MHLIRPEKVLEVPIKLGMGGTVQKIVRRDVRTGKIDYERGPKPNTLMIPGYLDKLFTERYHTPLNWAYYAGDGAYTSPTHEYSRHGPLYRCYIGDSNATPNDTSLTSLVSLLATVDRNNTWHRDRSALGANPMWVERTYIFPAGTGTGTVREIGVGGTSPLTTSFAARQVLSEEIVKSEFHQLEVTWRLSLSIPEAVEGTKIGGQRDGVTDIDWRITVNNAQRDVWAQKDDNANTSHRGKVFRDTASHINPLGNYGDDTLVSSVTPTFLCGDSNATSNIAEDTHFTLKGSSLFSGGVPSIERESYVPGTGEISCRVGFDVGDANGNICEMIASSNDGTRTFYGFGALCRIAFKEAGTAWGANVGLDKVDNYRLFLDIKFQLEDVNAT